MNYHSAFVYGVEAHDCDMEVYYRWHAVLLGRSRFVVKLRVFWQDVFECQTGDSMRVEVMLVFLRMYSAVNCGWNGTVSVFLCSSNGLFDPVWWRSGRQIVVIATMSNNCKW